MNATHEHRLSRVARVTGVPKAQVRAVLEAWVTELVSDLKHFGRAALPSFGVFFVATRKARSVVGVQSDGGPGVRMLLPASWRVAFRASKHQKGTGDGPP